LNLLFVTVAMIVPFIGQIVAMGYQATVVDALARRGREAPPPRFDLARLGEYLLPGVRMFVVSLVMTCILLPIVWLGSVVVLAVVLGVTHAIGPQEAASTFLGCALLGVFGLIFAAVMLVAQTLATPAFVRAAIDPDFGGIFDFAYVRDFLSRTGAAALKAHLFVVVLHVGLFLVGLLACVIGIFPALGFGMLVQAHMFGQLYLLYLERGGRRVHPG
ncbi:MAG TPA: DUF4013 domain-containing protein, partial [Thermoanaerobaculia bacterium]|nr:DUF4013 domain-containing protein [Thermoanaerobaculia bacterium]